MLERALKLKKALHNATVIDKDLIKYKLSDNEWIIIDEIYKLMQICNLLINILYNNNNDNNNFCFICSILRKVQIFLQDIFILLFHLAFQHITIY